VAAPVFAADGTLQTTPGYHPSSRTFYAPAPGFEIPSVPSTPSAAEVEVARRLLLEEFLGDFPFATAADRAQALGLLLLAFVRALIPGPTPLHLIEASTPGTGKSLLAEVLLFVALGRWLGTMTEASQDEEWRKRVTSQLLQAPAAILLDNLRRPLDAGSLAAVLTTTTWEDRLLNTNQVVRLPNQAIWVATANNPELSEEFTRRTVAIRLDARCEQPWIRTGFRHAGLRGWTAAHRADLVGATLTLVQAWVAAGRPPGTARLGSYEAWAAVIGGILAHNEIDGFLADLPNRYASVVAAQDPWRALVARWAETHGTQAVGAKELFPFAVAIDEFVLSGTDERARRTSFGAQLRQQKDRIYDGWQIREGGRKQNSQQWRLVPVDRAG
jgi:hypothetical protein